MDLLDALGVKAVGLRRSLPFVNFVSWLFKAPRSGSRPISKITLIIFCLVFIYGSRAQLGPVVYLEAIVLDIVTPVVAIIQKPLSLCADLSAYLRTVDDLRAENALLKAQNENILRANMALSQQAFMDHQARDQLKFVQSALEPQQLKGGVVVNVLNTPPSGMPLLIQYSESLELFEDAVAIGTKGVIGRFQAGGQFFGKVTTLIDPTSRIPVEVAGVQAIASGQGSATLKLTHIQEGEHNIQIGDIAFTSGFGGIFPKAIPVGRVSSIENKEIMIQPFESLQNLHTLVLLQAVPKA